MFEDRILLITGGTGSFGNAVLKRFLHTNIGQIRVFSRDEKKQDDMRRQLKSDKVKFYIGDVRDSSSVAAAMYGVDYVIHAAALKQVPSCEFFPMEAVRTNVVGTDNVLEAAIQCGVKRVVCLSTDKAVYPINAMGMSKGLMEKVMIARARQTNSKRTVICGTRYGNIMGSRGSVIPLFIQQAKSGQALTVTDPGMTRFLMRLDEAVELVLFAFTNGHPGDIFVQKSPASTVGDLAEGVRRIFNPGVDIRVIGTRHGEKLYETLITREDMVYAQDLGGYYRIPPDSRDLNYDKYFSTGEHRITEGSEYTSENTDRLDVEQVMDKLLSLDFVQEELKGWRVTR